MTTVIRRSTRHLLAASGGIGVAVLAAAAPVAASTEPPALPPMVCSATPAGELDCLDGPDGGPASTEHVDAPEDPCVVMVGLLQCGNEAGAFVFPDATRGGEPVDVLDDTAHDFLCYAFGEAHDTGSTWYLTKGDRNDDLGFVPASAVQTSVEFDADPSAHGLPWCPFDGGRTTEAVTPAEGPVSAPVALDPMEGGCGISHQALWCGVTGEVPVYQYGNPESDVKDWLQPEYHHGFVCYVHAGANETGDTWFLTQGDGSFAIGYVAASDVLTTPEFDFDPSAHGMTRCPF